MTTEEKAKAYDEALEWMRKIYPTITGANKEDAEHYFPELKESEDERIRKAIREILLDAPAQDLINKDLELEKALAWLEKQKAVKTPQWMIDFLNDIRTASINKEGYDDYDGRREYEGKILAIIRWLEGNFIQQKEQKPAEWSEEEKDKLNSIERLIISANARNYLIGDKEAAELQHFIRSIVKPTTNLAEWSEEDENKLNHILEIVHIASGREASVDEKEELESFLKSLRPQPKPEQKPETKLTRWVARDENGEIYAFEDYPEKDSEMWIGSNSMILDRKSFPDLKWED